ncbi:MAG: BREX system P-loop protein BrxC, partial [Pusillimonas sp.]
MTTLKHIFQKPVNRPIEGVIKADDDASLRLEVEEYVLTNEVEKRLESFLDAYNNYTGANGVWLSGFFGSGKSHLLKMLALLLENREVDGARTLDLFLPKCGDNEILRGDLKRAVAIPSKSILFNIDQKADVISKTQIDALLAVFVKVFDEMCGYYGKQGHIAQFERDLDSRNLYEPFKQAYESVAGRTWHKGREQALLESRNIAKAYAQVTGGDETTAAGILDKYRSQHRLSIEDFAEQVNAYIERQPANFRLNFFVDEVGQYIAQNVKLMTNLQTVAESLATKSRGRAWIIVTAQEDMGSVIGEMGKQQGNDFSKIQARFANRMKLTSQNVDEVIQKRLLTKTEDGTQTLSDIYHDQANNFKTLFDFADGSQTYRNFQDRDHFIHCYPFVPYQFALFQSAIQNLSQHNAFEGKHSSVGERSMLGVFQQVAIQISDHEIGQLATFDLMFEGIRTALKANIQRAVLQAENHLDSPFAIRVLKALFLVKYVKEFKPTVRNLCVLMLEGFNHDLPALKKRLEEALSLLEQQTYIQRNGDVYEFLTDEEKDVEQEIKNTEVEASDVAAELEKIVFDHVIKQRKIRYDQNEQDYPFARKLDERLHGRDYELGIHVVSPFHEHSGNETTLRMHSMGRDELVVIMPPDERLMRDLLMYKRTEKYIRQNISIAQQEAIKRILTDKGFQNRERFTELQQRTQELLGKATLLLSGANVDLAHGDAQNRIVRGFHELITRAYPNLRMLRGHTYTENDIAQCLDTAQDGLFGNDATTLAESEQEVLAFIQSNGRSGVRTTLKSLVEKFERRPYGWYLAAILCTLAKLCARGKVVVSTDSNTLEDADLERALRNTQGFGNVVLEPQVEFSNAQVRGLKEFHEDFFDGPPSAGEAKALGKETLAAMQGLVHQLAPLLAQTAQYPFLVSLKPVHEKLQTLAAKPYTWYLTELSREEDDLLDMKESVIDPIRKFMSGPQK